MVRDNKTAEPVEAPQAMRVGESGKAMKLVTEMLAGKIINITPQLDFTSEPGFTYAAVEQTLEVKGKEVVSILETLVDKGILRRDFFDRLLRCPQCQSMNLRPTTHCSKCGSGDIVRGRVFEHFVCGYVGLEDEFVAKGRYICPKCKVELRAIGSDYQSLGLLRKCRECGATFGIPAVKWRCLKCSSLRAEDKVIEVNIYSYRFNEAKRSWLEFELKPKHQLMEFLRERGYEVVENATIEGRSGAAHSIDILATRDDGVISHSVVIGVNVVGDRIGLEEIFDFDDKAYDVGIHDKVLVVIPKLSKEAEKFASQQRIKVLQLKDLDAVLAGVTSPADLKMQPEPFQFASRSQLVDYLRRRGYQVEENTAVKGRSGAEHEIDILATMDDGIIKHHVAIGIEKGKEAVQLDKVFDFDNEAYDIGILDKVFIATPGLTEEARRFAERQRITVFEVKEIEPSD